jgi:NADPH:quinone reductase-like Zn-dependent oxidoreductase
MMRLGLLNHVVDLKTPLILGTELIGEVTSVGEKVTNFKVYIR